MFSFGGEKYDMEMNTGTILEILGVVGLIAVFGWLLWYAKRQQGIPMRALIALLVLFLVSVGTMMLCRMSFIGVMAQHADEK